MKRILGAALFVSAMISGLLIFDASQDGRIIKSKAKQYGSIIRLHTEDGRFFCSGTVISAKYALTAGHCVAENYGFFVGVSQAPIAIYSDKGTKTTVIAKAAAANMRGDVAIIEGDFSEFEQEKIETDANKVAEAFQGTIRVCGYPWGGKLSCNTASRLGKYYFMYTSEDGFLYPGMSGGPVFNADGKIVGVNSGGLPDVLIYAPIAEIEGMLKVTL